MTIGLAPIGLLHETVTYTAGTLGQLADYVDEYDPESAVDLPAACLLPYRSGLVGEAWTACAGHVSALMQQRGVSRSHLISIRWIDAPTHRVCTAIGVRDGPRLLDTVYLSSHPDDVSTPPPVMAPRREIDELLASTPFVTHVTPIEYETDVTIRVIGWSSVPDVLHFGTLRDVVYTLR